MHVAVFAALTGLGSFIRIPLPLVPITMQTFFVYLSGNLLGGRKGTLSQIIFLTIGLAGIPVFSMGGGLGYIFKPSFGYLAAFPAASWLAGTLIIKFKGKHRFYIANICAAGVIFFAGVIYLFISSRVFLHINLSVKTALWTGVAVLVPGEIIKIILAGAVAQRLQKTLERE